MTAGTNAISRSAFLRVGYTDGVEPVWDVGAKDLADSSNTKCKQCVVVFDTDVAVRQILEPKRCRAFAVLHRLSLSNTVF